MFFQFENIFFFVNDHNEKLRDDTVCETFIKLSVQVGLRKKTDHHGPRIHDLRHTFAVKTILRWYKDGLNVDLHLPLLSAYLGHTLPSYTYWYLTGTPELLTLTSKRLEKNQGGK
jgi:integrase/recombinase XerD